MIVSTKPTRTTSWTTSSASIPLSPPRGRKSGVALKRTPPSPRIRARRLGQVVPDVAEDVLDLATQEDHRDDHGNCDNGNDECVLDQALTVVVAEEALKAHGDPPFSGERRLRSFRPQVGKPY